MHDVHNNGLILRSLKHHWSHKMVSDGWVCIAICFIKYFLVLPV